MRWIVNIFLMVSAVCSLISCHADARKPGFDGSLEFQVVVFDQFSGRTYPGNVNPANQSAHVVTSSTIPVRISNKPFQIVSSQDGVVYEVGWDHAQLAKDGSTVSFKNFWWGLENRLNNAGGSSNTWEWARYNFELKMGDQFKLLTSPLDLDNGGAAWAKKAQWAIRARWRQGVPKPQPIEIGESYRKALEARAKH